jgi:hypothetical protein
LLDRLLDHPAEKRSRENRAVDVRDIGPKDQRRLFLPGKRLQIMSLADGQLNRIWRSLNKSFDSSTKILNALEKTAFIEETVIHRDIEATVGFRIEKAVQAILFHEPGIVWQRGGRAQGFSEVKQAQLVAFEQ